MIGPLRGIRSSCSTGSLNVLSGLRSRDSNCGSGRRSPSSAQTTITSATMASVQSGPTPSALMPHTQLPAAMPPKVAVW